MARIAEAGGRAFAVRARFGESGAVDRLFEGLTAGLADHGADGLDILVNNAGIHSVSSIGQLTEEEFERLLAINVTAPVFVVQRALPLLRDGGRIVNVGSAATRIAAPCRSATPSPRRRWRPSARRSPTSWAGVGSP